MKGRDQVEQNIQGIKSTADGALSQWQPGWFASSDEITTEKSVRGAISTTAAHSNAIIQEIATANYDANGNLDESSAHKINTIFLTTVDSLKEIGAWSDDNGWFALVEFVVVETAKEITTDVRDVFSYAEWARRNALIIGIGLALTVALVFGVKSAVGL